MPRGDRTGPQGRGSMTGQRQGYCAGNNNPDWEPGFGCRGRGKGFFNGSRNSGFGRGNGMGYGNRARFQTQGIEGEIASEIGQTSNLEEIDINMQLTKVLDQLSKLIKQLPESPGAKDEKE